MKWVLLVLLELLQINCSPFYSSAFVCIMESKADLEAKIALYTQQLGQVDELLQIDATNPEFLKLKEDLVSLITLTKALLIQTIEATNNAQHSSSAVETKPPTSCSSSGTSAPSAVALRTGPIQVGEVVEVSGGERPFAGVVTAIVTETEYKIKYYEYPDEVSLPLTALHRLPLTAFTPEQIHIGLMCQCKYALDQKYYDCKVTAFTSYGCMVQYTAYGNAEEVPLAYLKPATPVNKTAVPGTERVGKNNLKPGPDGLIAIPESLTILPTDTEKEIEKKRKEVKSIKNKNRLISQATQMEEAQNSWKKFVTKGSKRLDSGIVKNSMFSSPDEVAGKVGVVNSGKKMTDFGARKKHKFDTF